MENVHENTVVGIASSALAVAADHRELTDAIDAERTAEALLLRKAIDATRPALTAITSRLKSVDRTTGNGTDRQRSHVEYHEQRGLLLDGDGTAERDAPRDNSGRYDGFGVYVLADGTLAEREFSGSWSKWQGDSDNVESTLTPISDRDAMDTCDLERCLKNLSDALEKQLKGKAADKAKAARARAEKLAALIALV